MKNYLVPAVVIVLLFAAYSFGQAGKPRPKCCCEHSQQMAEDIRAIRKALEDFPGPPPPVVLDDFVDPGDTKPAHFDYPGVKSYKPGQKRR